MPSDPGLNLQSNGTVNGSVASGPSAGVKLNFSLSNKSQPSPSSTTTPTSFTLTKKPQDPSRSLSGTKRPHSLLDSDTQADSTHESTSTISSFGADLRNGTKEEAKQERVIVGAPNKDWREEARRKRQKSGIPGQQGQQRGGVDPEMAEQEMKRRAGPTHGLTVMGQGQAQTQSQPDAAAPLPPIANDDVSAPSAPPAPAPQTADDEALAALLGTHDPSTYTTIRPPSPPPDEDEAFRADYNNAPRMATLDEYAATPVEGFGAAILRGYLKPGETLEGRTGLGKKEKSNGQGGREQRRDANGAPVRRPGLLGLGAKADAGAGVELGAWGKGGGGGRGAKGKGGNRGPETAYMPVAMRNKKTGEVVTEEELKRMVEDQSVVDTAAELGRVGREREDGRRRLLLENGDGDSGRGSGREGRSRRDERDRDRDREYDSEEDERRRRRRKEKERERRRRDEDGDEDEYRSRRRDDARDRRDDSRHRDRGDPRDRRERRYDDDDEDYDRNRREVRRRDRSRDNDERERSDRRRERKRDSSRDSGNGRDRHRDRSRDDYSRHRSSRR